ncbi:hypothetical protein AOY83_22505 [Escherichia coli]|uniref:F4 family fimbrial subunit n=1 Tax=Escherichia coli TaxID=562 RepID=UPI001F0E0BC1|nr:hypothetical protein [Escherichia coli]UMS19629.1 hypothetical protein AOY83_22505 [Escherichia coli]
MKKTLIALAVAASAAVSGSAMAWTANGNGDDLTLGGTLTPVDVVTPWEVKVGAAVNNLNADIRKGDSAVSIPVKQAILALSIRTAENTAFSGRATITPLIDFKNAVDLKAFKGGVTTLTLDVKNGSNDKIGTLTAPFYTGAVGSIKNSPNMADRYCHVSAVSGDGTARGFMGGLATSWDQTDKSPLSSLNALSSEIMAKFDAQGMDFNPDIGFSSAFSEPEATYSAAYGSGILANNKIEIQLNEPVKADGEIAWTATLPITVFYQ